MIFNKLEEKKVGGLDLVWPIKAMQANVVLMNSKLHCCLSSYKHSRWLIYLLCY